MEQQSIQVPGYGAIMICGSPFIDGRFRSAQSDETLVTINPATGQPIASIAACGAADVDAAVASARKAFEDGRWSRRSPKDRKLVLQRFADLLDEHREELALLETLEVGKPISDTRSVDIPKAAYMIRWYAEAIDKQYGDVAPTGPTALALTTREPLGVVAAIIPWNFPLYLAAYKLGPALATGNSVILKPAEQSSLTALRAAELAVEAGLPEGVFNVVTGNGLTAGRALGLHMDVDCIAFTGSARTAKVFLRYAGESNMKKVQLEAGGKSPNIVMPDATDLDEIARQAAWGVFYNAGQVCSAGSRLLVHRNVHDELLGKIADVTAEMKIGDPLDEATQIGALIDEAQLRRVLGYIEQGKLEGAELVAGGNRTLLSSGGYFVEPTIFAGVSNQMAIARDEIFGPVLSVIGFDSADEAISIANDSDFALGAAVWTSSIDTAHSVSALLHAGLVWVNNYDASDLTVPWGGFKQTGTGRDKSLEAMNEYTGSKTVWIARR
ncbi:aldehyde dehydrogenase [Sphingomonas sp. NSE70-1]|uniref:Aldehyde dehydrogenase n=1 Tax=Sphingomonas caseinilyticus TaxID=2908205 RepID=A0ABT0RUD4_9SPHN|nr:aldehyde dehydrogenase [Sphingomonas caseinilyticus]MCL6698604.1 aldehyde dehydrogenase [Sphingomonas caseinilyticus]